jgi:XTP/dITP diphosphohydrolase
LIRARLCSQNAHKLDELRLALPGWEVALLDSASYPPEDGATYEANARGKALHGRAVGPADEWMLGEDSGIECDALDGAPGLRSARWAPAASQAAALVERLAAEPNRRARMVAVLIGIPPAGDEIVGVGVMDGEIAREQRGEGGFGYDPVFVPAGETSTVAELGDDWKRVNSHRARAAAALLGAYRDSAVGAPPVHLGAEDDDVRHHVEPHEEHGGA